MPHATFRGSQAQVDYAMTLPETLENFARGTITSSERFSLNEYLHTAEDDLAQCEAEINEHKGAIMVLEAKRRKIQNFIEKSHSLLAPVHRMPPEILSNIFSFCCQHAVQYLIPRVQVRLPLVSLSSVCQRWRDTVLSIPSLWSVLNINFEPWKWDFEQLERVVAMYLTRSKSHPLTLYLDLASLSTREEDRETSEKCIAILRRIVRESHRWETAELDISPSGLRHPVFQPIMGRLPLLKKLALYGCDDRFDLFNRNIAFNLDSLFSTCPALEHVLVNNNIASYGPVVPWHQIRTMDLKLFYNVGAFNSALAMCPKAERLYLANIDFEDLDTIHPGPSMPNIRHLSLEPWGDLFDTLDCLNLPGLTSVRLQGSNMNYWYKPTEDTNRRFRSFFDRTSGSIVSLSLATIPIPDEVIISLLRMVPTLEQLDIAEKYHREYKSISTYFWKSLSIVRPTSSHIVVPRLKELNLTFYGNDLDDDALLDTLTSRFDPAGDVACLKIITLGIMGSASKKLEESLGYLKTYFRSRGTRLSVECFKR